MERPSGIFWCTACKPLNAVWLIIPNSRGKITLHSVLRKTYSLVAAQKLPLHTERHPKNRCKDIWYMHIHAASTYRWTATKAKFKDNESGSVSSAGLGGAARDMQRNETSYNVDVYQAHPRNSLLLNSSISPPPSSSVFSLIVCGRRCSAVQLKHTRGWKT